MPHYAKAVAGKPTRDPRAPRRTSFRRRYEGRGAADKVRLAYSHVNGPGVGSARDGRVKDMERERAQFGPNSWLIEETYRQYLEDPASVGEAWREFFEDYADG
ncbi:MAG: 2-oxoglutarate dehydrogenase E1 subunit family protein, partial [Actinomycetota bacterium]